MGGRGGQLSMEDLTSPRHLCSFFLNPYGSSLSDPGLLDSVLTPIPCTKISREKGKKAVEGPLCARCFLIHCHLILTAMCHKHSYLSVTLTTNIIVVSFPSLHTSQGQLRDWTQVIMALKTVLFTRYPTCNHAVLQWGVGGGGCSS